MRCLLLAAALFAAPVVAQTADTLVVTPGTTLVTDWITPGTTTWTMKLVQPMQQTVGTMTREITIEGADVVRTSTLEVPMQGMSQTDVVRADAATLTPREHRSTGGMADVSLEFMAEGVVGTQTPRDGATETIMEMTDAPVFDGAWASEIAQSLPLVEGLVARIPIYSAQGGLTQVVAAVVGQEEVATAAGPRTAWTVDLDMGQMTVTTVIDAETRQALVTRFAPQPGVLIEIVPAD